MRLDPLDIGITLALAASLAALGELLLWRRSRDPLSWNESFLVGAGASAAALFPLSILSPRGALHAIAALLALSLIWILVRELFPRARPRSPATPGDGSDSRRDPISLVLLAGILIAAVSFAALNFRYAEFWDGFQIWSSKAQMIYHRGGLNRDWFPEDTYDSRILLYPTLVPLHQALLSTGRGGFDFDAVKPVFLTLYLSMLLSTFAAARAQGTLRTALAATLLLTLLPEASTGTAAGGYADMPQAAFVAGVAAAGFRWQDSRASWNQPLPWLIGALTTVKAEGSLLALVACLGVLLFWWMQRPRRVFARAIASWRGIAIVAAFLGTRVAYTRWIGVRDTTYGPLDAAHFERARAIFGTVVRLCLQILTDPVRWALFWPACLIACLVLAFRGTPREKCVVFATLVGIAVDTSIFLFTNWSPELQLPQAYPRLLIQLAPAAAVLIGYAYLRAQPGVAGTGS